MAGFLALLGLFPSGKEGYSGGKEVSFLLRRGLSSSTMPATLSSPSCNTDSSTPPRGTQGGIQEGGTPTRRYLGGIYGMYTHHGVPGRHSLVYTEVYREA